MSDSTIFPQTRLQLLSEVIRRGISPTYSDSGTQVINQKCVRHNGTLDLSCTRNHDSSARKISPDNYIQPGDALINSTGTGTLGRSAIVTTVSNPLTWDSHVTLVRPRSDYLDSRFLGYILQMSENRFITLSQGSTNQIELSRDVVANLPLPALSLSEQRRIADYLDRETARIDKITAALDGLVARLEERRRALITDVIWGEGYPTSRLGYDISFITSGSRGWSQYVSEHGVRFLRITDLNRNNTSINEKAPQYVFLPQKAEGTRSETIEDDLLLSITAHLGSVGLVSENETGCYVNQHIALVRLYQKMWKPRYIAYSILSEPIQRHLQETGVGGTKTGLSLGDVRMIPAPVPPLDEQRRIADHLDAETAKIDAMIVKAGELRALLDERRSATITATVTGHHAVPKG